MHSTYSDVDFLMTAQGREITQTYSATNPWAPASSSAPAKLLELARHSGYQVCTEETVARCQELRDSSASARYFRLLREISALDEKLTSINLELQRCAADKDTFDLTSVRLLEKRVNSLMQLSGHLNDVIRGKDLIVQRLKHPYSNDCLKVEPSHQRHVVEVFKLASSLLTDLSYNLENVDWSQKHLASVASSVEKELWKLTASADQLKATVTTAADFRNAVGRLQESRRRLEPAASSS